MGVAIFAGKSTKWFVAAVFNGISDVIVRCGERSKYNGRPNPRSAAQRAGTVRRPTGPAGMAMGPIVATGRKFRRAALPGSWGAGAGPLALPQPRREEGLVIRYATRPRGGALRW